LLWSISSKVGRIAVIWKWFGTLWPMGIKYIFLKQLFQVKLNLCSSCHANTS